MFKDRYPALQRVGKIIHDFGDNRLTDDFWIDRPVTIAHRRDSLMNNAQKPRPDTKHDQLDLLPRAEGMKRADDLLRTLLSSPPNPHTPKPKAKQPTKK